MDGERNNFIDTTERKWRLRKSGQAFIHKYLLCIYYLSDIVLETEM